MYSINSRVQVVDGAVSDDEEDQISAHVALRLWQTRSKLSQLEWEKYQINLETNYVIEIRDFRTEAADLITGANQVGPESEMPAFMDWR